MSSFFCYFFLFSLLLGLFLFYSEVCFSLFFKEVYASIEGYGVLSDLPNLRLSDWIFYSETIHMSIRYFKWRGHEVTWALWTYLNNLSHSHQRNHLTAETRYPYINFPCPITNKPWHWWSADMAPLDCQTHTRLSTETIWWSVFFVLQQKGTFRGFSRIRFTGRTCWVKRRLREGFRRRILFIGFRGMCSIWWRGFWGLSVE